jgi:O-antigen/teichoic acid export membrane protein
MNLNIQKILLRLVNGLGPHDIDRGLRLGILSSALTKVVGFALALLVSIILAHVLGAEIYGVYAYALSWGMVLSVAAVFGTDVLSAREVAKTASHGNGNRVRDFICWSVRVVIVRCIGLTLLACLALMTFKKVLEPNRTAALWSALPILSLLAFLRLGQGILQGLGFVTKAQVPILLLVPVVFLTTIFSLSLSGIISANTYLYAYSISLTVALSLTLFWLMKSGVFRISLGKHMPVLSAQWRASTYSLAIAALSAMLNEQIGVIMLGSAVGTESAGLFDVARKAAGFVAFGLVVINLPLAPLAARLYYGGDIAELQRSTKRAARGALMSGVCVAVVLLSLGPSLLGYVGPEYKAAYLSLMILTVGQVINVASGPVGLLLTMTGHENDYLKALLVSLTLNAFLCAILIGPFGLEGAAVATSAALATWNIILVFVVKRRLSIEPTAFGRIHV